MTRSTYYYHSKRLSEPDGYDDARTTIRKRKKAKYKSYKGEIGKVAPNVIDRDFIATAPNQKWTTDVTEVNIKDNKIYLSPILDMFNREIISYTISYHPDLKMAMSMLDKAFL